MKKSPYKTQHSSNNQAFSKDLQVLEFLIQALIMSYFHLKFLKY